MAAQVRAATAWTLFPMELKFAVIELLTTEDIHSFSKASSESYALCVPTLFKTVNLPCREALQLFLAHVPKSYGRHIRSLSIRTLAADGRNGPVTESLSELLEWCTQLEHLQLSLADSVRPSILSSFEKLRALRELGISNCGDENSNPFVDTDLISRSERLVVSMAASLPKLSSLTLDRIARSAMHAPELVGCNSFIPVCTGDNDIPAHPVFGQNLSLPVLLRLPNLRYLRIRDTHLGDTAWSTTPIMCSLEVLDLGSCYFESPEFNRVCTERIIGNVGNSVDEFSVSTPLKSDTFDFAKPISTPLKRLRKVHLTPLLPVENVVDTLTTLSGSPVEELSVSCHEDDMEDMCEALKGFLALREERRDELYPRLTEISLKTVGDDLESVKGSMTFPVTSDVSQCGGDEKPAVYQTPAPQAPLPRMGRSVRDM
ncbi:hypothetical protein BXZ70DRAFT_895360 [Cristinia sonorae]|uniref:F-box domain-containing protein n=1 Tax=Cristinia sonorae TaxID=1940300 RepID=A0A8K0XNR4_9AGAR|nr:hypothetical protein BXZ70DRAFT_895360 [Cristinia sonorae]